MDRLPLPTDTLTDSYSLQRAIGALCGSAVGDALGAPFEFGPAGQWSARFPEPVLGGTGEMIGGGGFEWAPGEFTDDTQMAMALAESILERGGLDPADVWDRFALWAGDANDVGVLTRRVLRDPDRIGAAERAHVANGGLSAANGALMRVTPVAVAWASATPDQLWHAACAQAALTHFDPAAGHGAAIASLMIQRAIHGGDPLDALPDALDRIPVDQRARYVDMLDASWTPHRPGDPGNGSVWTCLAEAVWAVRHHDTFAGAVTAAIELGGDTDTVATVTGAIAGARASVQGIPSRWLTMLNGTVTTPTGVRTYDNVGLQDVARRLFGRTPLSTNPYEPAVGPVAVAERVHAANLAGAATAPKDWAIVSMCVTQGLLDAHPVRREVFLIDQAGPVNVDASSAVRDAVDSIDAFLAEGRDVVVHCHGGRSRTGLVLKAWAMRTNGWDERTAHDWLAERWPLYDDYQTSFVELLRSEW
jgi:ADP-ribosyl-[dinitrogen reductase] hydrolase